MAAKCLFMLRSGCTLAIVSRSCGRLSPFSCLRRHAWWQLTFAAKPRSTGGAFVATLALSCWSPALAYLCLLDSLAIHQASLTDGLCTLSSAGATLAIASLACRRWRASDSGSANYRCVHRQWHGGRRLWHGGRQRYCRWNISWMLSEWNPSLILISRGCSRSGGRSGRSSGSNVARIPGHDGAIRIVLNVKHDGVALARSLTPKTATGPQEGNVLDSITY